VQHVLDIYAQGCSGVDAKFGRDAECVITDDIHGTMSMGLLASGALRYGSHENGYFAGGSRMPLRFESYIGHELDRRVCRFSMTNGDREIQFIAGWDLMDELERGWEKSVDQRDEQFLRVKEALIMIARQKFTATAEDEPQGEIILDVEDRKLFA